MATAVALSELDRETKLRFAAALARTDNAAAAAMSIIPDNPGRALFLSTTLVNDTEVIAELDRLKQDIDPKKLLPSKYDAARLVYDKAQDTKDAEEFSKLMRLYADIMGFIERPGANVDVNVQLQNVMVVRDHGTNEEWRKTAEEQQRRLILDAEA